MTDMGFWVDDALISIEIIAKVYSDEPGIEITVIDDMVDNIGGDHHVGG